MCCSNWEVAAPSIVQWPELWTRGASSLTTSVSSGIRNSSTVRVPWRSIAAASAVPIAAASSVTRAEAGAGTHVRARTPASCTFRPIGKVATWSPARATITESSIAKASSRSASRAAPGCDAEALPGTVELVRGGDPDLAPAVIAAGRQLETERQAQCLAPPPALPRPT